ncbi:DUF305 domain-containing protein [Streptomyces sp. NPDC047046]|uniref:DUF305 domain-containing protein n=1 Tax=Streptomyces sp. NPDC047046 TaxID=3155378 RepID=UPI0033F3B2C3
MRGVLSLALCLGLAACGGGGQEPDGGVEKPRTSASSVIAPGKPGEPAKTLSPKEAESAKKEDDRPNTADFRYVAMMTAHHAQAIELSGLVPGRASSAGVKALAERIADTQGPEIDAMKGWQAQYDPKGTRTPEHAHGTMPGMATKAQLTALKKARGKDFDQLFLRLMTKHHEGAIAMAGEVLGSGNNMRVEEMANDVVAQQSSEIHRMEALAKG